MQCYKLGEGGGDVVSPLLTPPYSILFQFCLVGGCWLPGPAMSLATAASSLVPGLIYCWYVILDHRPSILMTVSGTPAWLADVAAPILKLWPLKCCPMAPDVCKACCTPCTNCLLRIGSPSCFVNNAPGLSPLTVK